MFIKWYFLFSGVSTKKMRNLPDLIERKALVMSCEKEKRSNEALRTEKTRLRSLGESMVGRATWHHRATVD